jgi:hypothetical protein
MQASFNEFVTRGESENVIIPEVLPEPSTAKVPVTPVIPPPEVIPSDPTLKAPLLTQESSDIPQDYEIVSMETSSNVIQSNHDLSHVAAASPSVVVVKPNTNQLAGTLPLIAPFNSKAKLDLQTQETDGIEDEESTPGACGPRACCNVM